MDEIHMYYIIYICTTLSTIIIITTLFPTLTKTPDKVHGGMYTMEFVGMVEYIQWTFIFAIAI